MQLEVTARAGKFDDTLDIRIAYEEWNSKYTPHSVLVTRNGFQWSGFGLSSIEEIETLADALRDYADQLMEEAR